MEQRIDQTKPIAIWEKDFRWGAAADDYTRYTVRSRNGWIRIFVGGGQVDIPPEAAVWFAEAVAQASLWDGTTEAGSSDIEDPF